MAAAFRIVAKDALGPTISRLVVEAPLVARKRQAGHFVIVRVVEGDRDPGDARRAMRRGRGSRVPVGARRAVD